MSSDIMMNLLLSDDSDVMCGRPLAMILITEYAKDVELEP